MNYVEEKLSTFDSFPKLILDHQNNIIFLNAPARAVLDLPATIKHGDKFKKQLIGNLAARDIFNFMESAKKDNQAYCHELTISESTYSVLIQPFGETPSFKGVSASLVDISSIRQKETENALLYQIASTMSSPLPIEAISKKLLLEIVELMGLSGGSIMLVDNLHGHLYVETATDHVSALKILDLGEGVAGWVAKTGQPLAIPHTKLEKRYRFAKEEIDHSLLAVPLINKGEILGVLNLWKQAGEYFSEQQTQTFTIVASRIADVLHMKNLNEIAQKRLELGEILNSSLELEPALSRAIHKVSDILNNAKCSIHLFDQSNHLVGFVSSHHPIKEFQQFEQHISEDSLKKIFSVKNSSFLSLDEWRDETWSKKLSHHLGHDISISGLISRDRIFGILSIHSPKVKLSKEKRNLICEISSQLALAIENGQLYDKSRQEVEILDSIQKTTDQGIMLFDHHKRISYINQSAIKLLRIKKSVVGLKVDDFINDFSNYSRISQPILALAEMIKRNQKINGTVNCDLRADRNMVKHLVIDIKHLPTTSRQHPNILVTIDDVTDLYELQEKVSERLKQITKLFKITSLRARESKETIARIVDQIPDLLQAETAMFFTKDAESEFTTISEGKKCQKCRNLLEKLNQKELNGELPRKKEKYLFYPQDKISLALDEEFLPPDLDNFIYYPVVIDWEYQGSLVVGNHNNGKNFTQEDGHLLAIIAKQIAAILENSRLLDEVGLEKERLSAIIRHSADGMMIVNDSGKIVSWNKAMEKLTGFHNEEVIGEDVNSLIRLKSNNMPFSSLIRKASESKRLGNISEVEIQTKSGESKWLDIHYAKGAAKSKSGGFNELVVLFNDVSRYKELEIQKNEFISMTAHELRTPLTAIKGYLSMIIGGDAGPLNEKQEKYFSRSYKSTERLVSLVEDLLNLLRIEEKRMVFNIQRAEINQIAKDVILDLTQKAKQKDINLTSVNLKEDKYMVAADPDRTKQILGNLIDNAIKYTPRGGKVTVKLINQPERKRIAIEVKDNGVGISSEQVESIFNKFHRADNPLSRQAGGYGLGLFITKSLVEQQGGEIWVKSEPGKGSTFTFSLPWSII